METPSVPDMLKQLVKVKHLMNDFESHPRGTTGINDLGGFVEKMEFAVKKGWSLSDKQIACLVRIYKQRVLGEDTRSGTGSNQTRITPTYNADAFQVGKIQCAKGPEGWRLKLYNIILGQPVIREHAYVIAQWLDNAKQSVRLAFAKEEAELAMEAKGLPVQVTVNATTSPAGKPVVVTQTETTQEDF